MHQATTPDQNGSTSLEQIMRQWAGSITTGLTIKPLIEKNHSGWNISLIEDWNSLDGFAGNDSVNFMDLDEVVNWSNQELSKWDNVQKTSWASWCFDNERSSEKFLTLFYLKWSQ